MVGSAVAPDRPQRDRPRPSDAGEFLSDQRLVNLVARNLAAGLPAPESMPRVVHALLDHQADELGDDATVLHVEWHGETGVPP
jgi:Stage II sporulation protein E (SpoIIE)